MPYSDILYWSTDKDIFHAAVEKHRREQLERLNKLWRQLEEEYQEHKDTMKEREKQRQARIEKNYSKRKRGYLEASQTSRLGARVKTAVRKTH